MENRIIKRTFFPPLKQNEIICAHVKFSYFKELDILKITELSLASTYTVQQLLNILSSYKIPYEYSIGKNAPFIIVKGLSSIQRFTIYAIDEYPNLFRLAELLNVGQKIVCHEVLFFYIAEIQRLDVINSPFNKVIMSEVIPLCKFSFNSIGLNAYPHRLTIFGYKNVENFIENLIAVFPSFNSLSQLFFITFNDETELDINKIDEEELQGFCLK